MAKVKKRKIVINKWVMRKVFKEAGYMYLLFLCITKNMLQIRTLKMIIYSLI